MEKLKSEPVAPQTGARRKIRSNSRARVEINSIVKKSIAEVKGMPYNPDQGKLDRTFRGLGKEVKNGSL
jgi:hypothetical protein